MAGELWAKCKIQNLLRAHYILPSKQIPELQVRNLCSALGHRLGLRQREVPHGLCEKPQVNHGPCRKR